jgi:ribosome-binding factor A
MSRRTDRINGLLRQEISQLLSRQIKDPRLGGVVSITQVKTAGDLRSATVFVSVLGDAATKQSALQGIQSATAFLRRELGNTLALRYVPYLKFVLDDTLETAGHLLEIMDRVKDNSEDGQREEGC